MLTVRKSIYKKAEHSASSDPEWQCAHAHWRFRINCLVGDAASGVATIRQLQLKRESAVKKVVKQD